jgi:hypothetical protein
MPLPLILSPEVEGIIADVLRLISRKTFVLAVIVDVFKLVLVARRCEVRRIAWGDSGGLTCDAFEKGEIG